MPTSEDRATPGRRRRVLLAWLFVALWAWVIWQLGGDDFSLADTSRTLLPWIEWLIGDVELATRYKIYLAIRKSAHFIEYAILALLTFRAALLSAQRNRFATAGWSAVSIVLALAAADEARQAFSAERTGSPYDVLIDLSGGLIAIVAVILISRRLRGPLGPESTTAESSA